MQMARNAAVIAVFSGLLCLTFSYTFPLNKDIVKWTFKNLYGNHSANTLNVQDAKDIQDPDKLVESAKVSQKSIAKSTTKRIIKETNQSEGNNQLSKLINNGTKSVGDKNKLSEEDFRHYEKLVIIKKYPYLDIKELELKYSPTGKHARQSMKFEPGESNLCESVDGGPNVEISNRGLSGFSIPPQLAKHVMITEINTKSLIENLDNKTKNINVQCSKTSPQREVLISLENDIKQYVKDKKSDPKTAQLHK